MIFNRSDFQISFIIFWVFLCITSIYRGLSVILTSHFSNSAFLRPQIPNASTKYYKFVLAHAETLYNAMHNIANRHIAFKDHLFTLQKFPLLWNKGVQSMFKLLCGWAQVTDGYSCHFLTFHQGHCRRVRYTTIAENTLRAIMAVQGKCGLT